MISCSESQAMSIPVAEVVTEQPPMATPQMPTIAVFLRLYSDY